MKMVAAKASNEEFNYEPVKNSSRVQKKKNIPTIFLGAGAKKFTNNCSLLSKLSMISGKRKKTPRENNEIAPSTSSEPG